MQILHVVDKHDSDVGLGLNNRRRRPPFRPHTTVNAYSEGPEHARAPTRVASAQAPPALTEMQDAPHTESQRTGRRRPAVRRPTRPTTGEPAPQNWSNRAPRVAVDEPIRGAPRQALAARSGPRKAYFLRMAFIGASSGAAAFFFLMARRFMPFMAFAFFPPFRIFLV